MTITKAHRVLNLIKHVILEDASPKKRAVIKLLTWQPEAVQIRFEGRCHCRGNMLMSYLLPGDGVGGRRDPSHESCGYYCPSCGFGNAGSRPKRLRPGELKTNDKKTG